MEVDIVTPQRRLVENVVVESVQVPGAKGQLEILPDHAQLLSTLSTGPLVFRIDGGERKFAVSHGFVEVKENRVTVLAETCEESHEIDVERAKSAQKKAEEALGSSLLDNNFRKYERKLQRALVRQQIAN